MNKSLKITKKIFCLVLCFVMAFSFSSCSSNKMTEDNVTKTVEKVEQALIDFNPIVLKKYTKFDILDTLSMDGKINVNMSKISNKKDFLKLGKILFEDLKIEIVSINLEEQTVTLNVTNRILYAKTFDWLKNLKGENSMLNFLTLLNDKDFVKNGITDFGESVKNIPENTVPKQITVKFEQGKNNLILVFDSEAEDALTGQATIALKRAFLKKYN